MKIAIKIFEGEESTRRCWGNKNGIANLLKWNLKGGFDNVVAEGELEDGATSTAPTRMPPRQWTLIEAKLYADRWSYDGNTRDKIMSGEYVMGRPPKK